MAYIPGLKWEDLDPRNWRIDGKGYPVEKGELRRLWDKLTGRYSELDAAERYHELYGDKRERRTSNFENYWLKSRKIQQQEMEKTTPCAEPILETPETAPGTSLADYVARSNLCSKEQ